MNMQNSQGPGQPWQNQNPGQAGAPYGGSPLLARDIMGQISRHMGNHHMGRVAMRPTLQNSRERAWVLRLWFAAF